MLFMNRWSNAWRNNIADINGLQFNEICIFGSGVKAETRHVSPEFYRA